MGFKSLRFISLIFLIPGYPAGAQVTVDAAGSPRCSLNCYKLEVVQTLPAPDSVALGREDLTRSVIDGSGRAYVAPTFLPGRVLVFADGRQVATIGAYGEGPGEAERVSHLALGRGDSLHVFQPLARNVFGLDGEFGRYQRDPILPMQSNVRFGAGEVHVANTPGVVTARPPVLGLPSGGLAAGETPAVLDDPGEQPPAGQRRIIDPASSECLAVARAGEYRVHIYDADRSLTRVVRRNASWFDRWEDWELPTETRPKPRVTWVLADCERKLLWVSLTVAEDEGFVPIDPDPSRLREPLPSESATYDTLVEVIDWVTGDVVAAERFEGHLGPFQEGGHVLQPFVGEGGEQRFRVLRLSLMPD